MPNEHRQAKILDPGQLWEAYLKEKERLPPAIESWVRPFLVGDIYQKEYRWLCQQPLFPQAWEK